MFVRGFEYLHLTKTRSSTGLNSIRDDLWIPADFERPSEAVNDLKRSLAAMDFKSSNVNEINHFNREILFLHSFEEGKEHQAVWPSNQFPFNQPPYLMIFWFQ